MEKPPYHADQVGSLLRPRELREVRERFKKNEIDAAALREAEDQAIRRTVAKQEEIGLPAVTDGEFRRDFWHLDFLKQLDGVALTRPVGLTFNAADVPPMATVTGKVGCSKPIMADHFAFLKSVTKSGTPKQAIPAPGAAHFRGGRNAISREAYPELDAFWQDLGAAYRKAIRHLYDSGCRYLQLDDVGFSYLCDPKVRENFKNNGDDPAGLAAAYANAIALALKDRPADLTVTMHTCRGNFRSTWFAAGGYQDEVVEAMFSAPVDGYFMEYDSDRAGGFSPLRLLPKGRKVVLGIVTTKTAALEDEKALRRRIDEAARYVPLENLCISPQCGFASTHHGNALSEEEQWKKLELVVRVAQKVWG